MRHRILVTGVTCIALLGIAPVTAVHVYAATTTANPTIDTGANHQCGYDGYQDNGQPFYNHCGNTDIVIQVDHVFWQTTYDCVEPGTHRIDQGNSQWAIISAEYDGHLCSYPGPVVGP